MVLKHLKYSSRITLLYISLLLVVLSYFLYQSLGFQLHDFSNSYFAAKLIRDGGSPNTLFTIYDFNAYIWGFGYTNELVDFYLNSPFTVTFFYPLTFIEDPYIAKAFFNLFGMTLFVGCVYKLIKRINPSLNYLLGLIPFLFFIPIRNQILFGQSYFLILSFVILGFLYVEKSKVKLGAGLMALAVLLKIVPVLYGLYLLFKKKWKSILYIGISILLFLLVSVLISGVNLWHTYLIDILPNAILNNSTVDFRYNAQSMDVFLKTIFVKDAYYNPDALFSNERFFYFFKWIYKSLVIGLAISLSIKLKEKAFLVLSIWVVTLFLIQSRTATYAQILWIIPLIGLLSTTGSKIKKILFVGVIFLISNIPMYELQNLPLFFKFSRLWLIILAAIIFFSSFNYKINNKWIFTFLILFLPLHSKLFMKVETDKSSYVLEKKEHFLIYDYFEKEGELYIKTLSKNGDETNKTNISVNSFQEEGLEVKGNQILWNNKVLLEDYSLKKKPVIVNENVLYYLTDHCSRRGAFTLKKLAIETIP